jgi:HlyD family secretion protein
MDIARPDQKRKKRIRMIIIVTVVIVGLGGLTAVLAKLKPAAPTMDGSIAWPSTVTRGNMMIEVHGLGTLVPEDIRWIPAQSSARIDRILLRSGATVTPGSVIIELSDPQLQNDFLAAQNLYKSAQADFESLKVQLASQLMVLKEANVGLEGQFKVDSLQAKVDQQLADQGLKARIQAQQSQLRADQEEAQLKLDQEKLAIAEDANKAQIASQAAKVESALTLFELKKSQLDALHVRAGINGVVQCVCSAAGVDVQQGQQVALGTNLARVADPTKLKATVQVPETQAKDVVPGLKASVDTRNGIVKGHVTRIDAAPINGTVGVDISFDEALPNGARPDLSVDGTVEIQNMTNVLYIGRPVHGEPNSTVGIFKVSADGTEGQRVQVKLGRGSVNTIEVVGGLREGDVVILSDMSNYDNVENGRVQFSPRIQVR